MFTKILLTIVVLIGAILILRRKRANSQSAAQQTAKQIVVEDNNDFDWIIKSTAYGLVSLILLTGTIMYYLGWREDHRLYDIKIINPQSGKVDNYQAYKKDMYGRSFISITGERVTTSELERLEFIEAQ